MTGTSLEEQRSGEAVWISFLPPPGFQPLVDLMARTDPDTAEPLRVALNEAGIVHASNYAVREGERIRFAALTIHAQSCRGDAQHLARSLSRHEAAQGHNVALVDLPAASAALSVTDRVAAPGTTLPCHLARYRAWIPLAEHSTVLLIDLTTPHVSGWEDYGMFMAGLLTSLRVQEGSFT